MKGTAKNTPQHKIMAETGAKPPGYKKGGKVKGGKGC